MRRQGLESGLQQGGRVCWCAGSATDDFRTEDASGSTSQAANIMEALEVGADVLLIDEDTTATNFMIRDARMQASALLISGLVACPHWAADLRQLLERLTAVEGTPAYCPATHLRHLVQLIPAQQL